MAFVRRKIDLEFALGTNVATGQQRTFNYSSNSEATSVKFIGHKVRARINKAGGPSMGRAQVDIYGLMRQAMNQLSTIGTRPLIIGPNYITIAAGDDVNGMTVVYRGTISAAWVDYTNAPDVALHVEALAGLYEAVQLAPVSSYTGSTSVVVMLASLAAFMRLSFENNGVSATLSSPYYYGSPRTQAYAIAKHAGINIAIDDFKLVIWPEGSARRSLAPLISPKTGMVGYPSYTSSGISVLSLFNSSVSFGGLINVESSVEAANGTWNIYGLDYELDAITPNGSWFTRMDCARPGTLVARP